MIITTKNLSKRFNREWIFKDINLDFASHNKYAITGPNGSGKSTLLQVLWGQMVPSKGTVTYYINETEIKQTEVFKQISIATPYMDLIDEFTLYEMVNFHFSFKAIRNQLTIDELIERMELNHARDKSISNFSSGMRQRLKLGLAFYSETQALFLDEPTTNLDKKATEWYLKNLALTQSDTLVLIASNQEHEYPANSIIVDISAYKKGY